MRLDKFLSNSGCGSRSQVKLEIKKGHVMVNGLVIKQDDYKIDETKDLITVNGESIGVKSGIYIVMNKPKGVVCANKDDIDQTVIELLPSDIQKQVFTVGRLDKNTEGIILITDDGELSHNLLSPKKHVEKTYLVTCEKTVTRQDIERLESGIKIGDDEITLPAKVEITSDDKIIKLTICEGKYHQVKRMLQATCNKVLDLKRISFGPLILEDSLDVGMWRYLSKDEIDLLVKN